ncbi:MAG: acetolactate synthase small subunit [SAR324 cluster bacterium]|nr:acetolactate synthase small subunit [SAR324 cluster bacterium]
MTSKKTRQVLSILVSDTSGTLLRIAEIFGSRGYNVDSICSGSCEEPNCQRLTLVCNEPPNNIEKIVKLLDQLIDIYDITLINPASEITRELMLAKISFTGDKLALLNDLREFDAKIIRDDDKHISLEAIGTAYTIDKIYEIIKKYQIVEISRTGEAAIQK